MFDVFVISIWLLRYNDLAQWLSWLERRPVTAEVTGSSPVWVVAPAKDVQVNLRF